MPLLSYNIQSHDDLIDLESGPVMKYCVKTKVPVALHLESLVPSFERCV